MAPNDAMVLLLHGGIQCAQGKAVFESHQIIQTSRYGRVEVMVGYASLGRARLTLVFGHFSHGESRVIGFTSLRRMAKPR